MGYTVPAMLVRRPPSPWAHLLGGLGEGLGQGFNEGVDERAKKKAMAAKVLEDIASGAMDPRMLASAEGEGYLRAVGLDKNPDIRAALDEGRKQNLPAESKVIRGPGGAAMNLPSGKTLSATQVKTTLEGEEKTRKLQAIKDETTAREEAQAPFREKPKPEKTPAQKVQEARAAFEEAKRLGLPLDGFSFNGISIQTQGEKDKESLIRSEKVGDMEDEYYNAVLDGQSARAEGVKLITGLTVEPTPTTPEGVSALDANLTQFMAKTGISVPHAVVRKATLAEPRERAKILLRELNREIAARNDIIQSRGRRLGRKGGALIDPVMEEDLGLKVSPPAARTEVNGPSVARGGGIAAPRPPKPISAKDRENEVLATYEGLKGMVNSETQRPWTLAEVEAEWDKDHQK